MAGSLNGILSVARSGMLAQQLALQVTGNNIANASTPGYSRQRVDMVAGQSVALPQGLLGTGVQIVDITRARDALLDSTLRRDTALSEGFSTTERELQRIEAVLAEPTEAGLATALDAFWDSWSDLSNDPTSTSARAVVRARGEQLVEFFNRAANSFASIRADLTDAVSSSVGEVNRLLGEIADLNGQISAAVSGGQAAPGIEDQRDLLLDQLAALTEITVTSRANGGVGVAIDGISVVEGTIASTITATYSGGSYSIQTDNGLALEIGAGVIGGTLQVLESNLPSVEADLDAIARGLVERVNEIHSTGTNVADVTGLAFFDDLGDLTLVGARNLRLSADVAASLDNVVAGSAGGGGAYQPGANDVALALADLRTNSSGGLLDGSSVNEAYQELVAGVGVLASSAGAGAEGAQILVAAGTERRQSVSGVSTDEELIKIIQLQAAFSAAARVVSVVDEMYQTLLSI
jgi:flagellar hook-associated protein 1 FlgK